MDLISNLNDPAVTFVKQLLPEIVVELDAKPKPGIHGPSYRVRLPAPLGADYRFTLWLGGGEKEISARLMAADETAYFWYMPFEEAAFRSVEQLNKAFIDTVKLIVGHNTRIEQKRGLFFNHFKCEYESASGWQRIYQHSGLRWIRAPKTAARRQMYHSPRLVLS